MVSVEYKNSLLNKTTYDGDVESVTALTTSPNVVRLAFLITNVVA